jgi:hypothetical protein
VHTLPLPDHSHGMHPQVSWCCHSTTAPDAELGACCGRQRGTAGGASNSTCQLRL